MRENKRCNPGPLSDFVVGNSSTVINNVTNVMFAYRQGIGTVRIVYARLIIGSPCRLHGIVNSVELDLAAGRWRVGRRGIFNGEGDRLTGQRHLGAHPAPVSPDRSEFERMDVR